MRRFFPAAFFLLLACCFARTPQELTGIWQGNDRIVFFGEENQISIILKLYYGWYYDNAAASEKQPFIRKNAASSAQPQELHVEFTQLAEDIPAYEITVIYDKKTRTTIPVAVIGNELYLDFMIQADGTRTSENEPQDKNTAAAINGSETADDELPQSAEDSKNRGGTYNGFWQGINSKDTIRISPEKSRSSIFSWYITEKAAYRLTFWQTDMAYDSGAQAFFSDGETVFSIKKFIDSGGETYTCATGRRTVIRNIEKFSSYPAEMTADSTGKIIAHGKPAFVRAEASSREALENSVREANARRKPAPPPLFEADELDWHWDLINALEKDNRQIQEVRERQNAFGSEIPHYKKNN